MTLGGIGCAMLHKSILFSHACLLSILMLISCMICASSDLTVLQTKAEAAVKTGGLSGAIVSNGLQHGGSVVPLKVSFCRFS